MKIDKDDLLITTLISGVIICSPLIAVYCIAEWIYNQTPWQKKKKLKMNAEINELENRLGLIGRTEKALNYDPYFMKKNSSREEYLNDLRKKVAQIYQSPSLILATEEFEAHGVCPPHYSGDCLALVLVHIDYYKLPPDYLYCLGFVTESRANKYFDSFYHLIGCMIDTIGRLTTLSECGRYEDYFVVKIPGKFKKHEVCLTNKRIKQFVNEFKEKYGKQ